MSVSVAENVVLPVALIVVDLFVTLFIVEFFAYPTSPPIYEYPLIAPVL